MMNPAERATALCQMRAVSSAFYTSATKIGNHPFIEFCGLMNEYIQCCEAAHAIGRDFSDCNAHSGIKLPMRAYQLDYITEKLNCIFSDRIAVKETA